jgi:hypothetical protein
VPLQNLALTGVAPHDAGAASAFTNSAMQIGGSIGLSVFTAVYTGVVAGAGTGAPTPEAMTSGYSAVFLGGALVMVLGSVIAAALIRGPKSALMPQGEPALHLG